MLKKVLKLIFFVVLLSLPVLFWFNRYEIYDWWRLRGYTPSAEVVALASQTTMDDKARRIFYANHPLITDKQQLNENCNQGEYSIVLGCYVAAKGIFLYNVDDPRLNGVKEVTAAHEMLHAAYDRLSTSERKKVDEMTAAAFAEVDDERIKKTVEQYRARDPSIVPNELHSILATEMRDLSPELETYYKKYFTNRLVIVGFSEQYEGEFSSRQARVEAYDAQLSDMKTQIEADQNELNLQSKALEEQRRELERLSRQDAQAYNSQVDSFNALVRSYNNLASETKQLIEQYNTIVAERNALAVEVSDLAKAIDSRPQSLSTE